MTRLLARFSVLVAIAVLTACIMQSSSSQSDESAGLTQQVTTGTVCHVTSGGGSGTSTGGGFLSSCPDAVLEAVLAAANQCSASTTCAGSCTDGHRCLPAPDGHPDDHPGLFGCTATFNYTCGCACRTPDAAAPEQP